MKHIIAITLFIIILGCTESLDKQHPLYSNSTSKTEEHIRVPLTEIYAIFPDSSYFDTQTRRYRINQTDYIKFSKLHNVSWNDVKIKGSKRSLIPIYGCEGTYHESTKLNVVDILIQFGEKDCVYMITARTTNGQVGRDQIVSILKSIIYDKEHELDELEISKFTFDKKILNYNFLTSNKDSYFYGDEKGTLSLEYIDNYNEAECKEIFDNRISKEIEIGRIIKNKEIKEIDVKQNYAYVIQSKTGYQNNKGTYSQAILTNKINSMMIIWIANSDSNNYDRTFKEILESIKFK